jgi:pimeloyl-ACP methyl ester carboxylesterase
VLRVVSAHDVPLRSWVVDVAGVFARDYVWHEFAQIWQTPEAGEAWMAAVRAAPPGSPESVGAVLASTGVPAAEAAAMAARFDATMAESILDLYRSALPTVWADWGAELGGPTRGPGLVLQPTADPFDDAAASAAMAALLGARTERLDGLGHWWMLQDPKVGAAALQSFWSSLR